MRAPAQDRHHRLTAGSFGLFPTGPERSHIVERQEDRRRRSGSSEHYSDHDEVAIRKEGTPRPTPCAMRRWLRVVPEFRSQTGARWLVDAEMVLHHDHARFEQEQTRNLSY